MDVKVDLLNNAVKVGLTAQEISDLEKFCLNGEIMLSAPDFRDFRPFNIKKNQTSNNDLINFEYDPENYELREAQEYRVKISEQGYETLIKQGEIEEKQEEIKIMIYNSDKIR